MLALDADRYTDDGKALLGTPGGSGVSFFLSQHRDQLGKKVVLKANIWVTQQSGANWYNIGFAIGDTN